MKSNKWILALVLLSLILSLGSASLYVADHLGYRGDITNLTGITGKIGVEDINWDADGDGADDTFSITTYSGGTTNLTKIDARAVPWGSVAAMYLDDLVDEGYDLSIYPGDATFEKALGSDGALFFRESGDGAGFYRRFIDADGVNYYGDGTDAVGDTFTARIESQTYKIWPRLLLYPPQELDPDNATPSVGYNAVDPDMPGNIFYTNNTGVTITDFLDGDEGQILFVLIEDSGHTTIDCNGGNITCNGCRDWNPQLGDSMICTLHSGTWYCDVGAERPWWQSDLTAGVPDPDVSYDMCGGLNVRMVLADDIDSISTTNQHSSDRSCYAIVQAAGASYTVAFGPTFLVEGDAFTKTATNDSIDVICFIYNSTMGYWLETGRAMDVSPDT